MSKMQPVPLHTSSDKALPLSSTIIKILVGRDEVEREFLIHQAVLDARSGWFRKALSWRRARVEQEKDFHHYKKQMRAQIRERGTFSPQPLKQEEEASHNLHERIAPKNDHQATTQQHKHPEDLRQDITNQQKPSYEQLCVANGWSEKDSRWNWNHYNVERDAFSFPDESALVFSMYQQLVYTGQILEHSPHIIESEELATLDEMSTLTSTQSQCPDQCDHEYQALSSLYVLADNLRDPAAKGAAAKAIVSKCARNCAQLPAGHNCLPSATATRTIYMQTRQHCTGRQALVDSFVYYGRPLHFEKARDYQGESFPEEFLLDLVRSLLSVRVRPCKDLPADRLESYEENEEIWRLHEGGSLEKMKAAESSDDGLRA